MFGKVQREADLKLEQSTIFVFVFVQSRPFCQNFFHIEARFLGMLDFSFQRPQPLEDSTTKETFPNSTFDSEAQDHAETVKKDGEGNQQTQTPTLNSTGKGYEARRLASNLTGWPFLALSFQAIGVSTF